MTPILKLIALAAAIAAFWSVWLSVALLILTQAALLITLLALKAKKFEHVSELSQEANQMLRKFGHFYNKPFAGTSYSGTASLVMLSCISAGLVFGFRQAWGPTAVAAIGFIAMGFTARAFNPTNFLVDDSERLAHQEIIQYMQFRSAHKGRK